MRIRCKPWAKPELEACPFYLKDPAAFRGNWQSAFPNQKPLRIELGCGKGGFIAQEAPANPDYHYLAMDIKNEMLVLAQAGSCLSGIGNRTGFRSDFYLQHYAVFQLLCTGRCH